MSARKSFDLERKPATSAAKSASPKAHAKPAPKARPARSLRERRQARRNRFGGIILVLVMLVCGALIYGVWRPEIRVSEVKAEEVPDADAASRAVMSALSGRYFGIVPRDSIFFYPEQEARAALLTAFPELSAVSVSRDSFTALSVSGTRRAAAFHWCGSSDAAFSVASSCYEADADGFVFAKAGPRASSTPSLLEIYAPLAGAPSVDPVRGMVEGAAYLPNLLQFAQAVKTLGVPVLAAYVHADEAELFVTEKTRIKYVLGREEEAIGNLDAALKDLSLLDGTVEYLDLRFDGKVYLKRYE